MNIVFFFVKKLMKEVLTVLPIGREGVIIRPSATRDFNESLSPNP